MSPMGSHVAFGELWSQRVKRLRKASRWQHQANWRPQPLIVKHGDLMLQEEFAMQLLTQLQVPTQP